MPKFGGGLSLPWYMWVALVFVVYPYATGKVNVFTPKNPTPTPEPITVESIVKSSQATMVALTPTLTPTPAFTATPVFTATSTPVPVTPVSAGRRFVWAYSYYYPDLLGANCHPDNVYVAEDGREHCKNITSSGQGWHEYLGKGVAIPIEYSTDVYYDEGGNYVGIYCEVFHYPCIPYGSVIRVISPPQLVGDWTVVDTCPVCIHQKEGLVYLDFLTQNQQADWSIPVETTILTVGR